MACASFNMWEALYFGEQSCEAITIEMRVTPQNRLVFAVIDKEPAEARSIQELVAERPDCREISMSHALKLILNGEAKAASLVERFIRDQTRPGLVGRQLVLTVDERRFESQICNSLTEAMFSLDDMLGSSAKWWLTICFDCRFSREARFVPLDDRDFLVCYRDFPNQLSQIEQLEDSRKDATQLSDGGHFFVNAFHSCAAWKEKRSPDK